MMALYRRETLALGWCWWWTPCWRSIVVVVLATWTATGQWVEGAKSASSSKPETVYLGRSSTGRLDCPYTANPPATLIVWLKDGRVIDPDSRVKVSKAGSLLIREAKVGDEGEYACAVYSPSGSTESSPVVQLLVRGKHAFKYSTIQSVHP